MYGFWLNGCHFPDDLFKWTSLNENVWILIKISFKFVPKGPVRNIPPLVQIMAWRRPGDKPLSEPMMVLFTDTYITQPQWFVSCVSSDRSPLANITLSHHNAPCPKYPSPVTADLTSSPRVEGSPHGGAVSSPISPQKQAQLRQALTSRRVTPVKSTAPGELWRNSAAPWPAAFLTH